LTCHAARILGRQFSAPDAAKKKALSHLWRLEGIFGGEGNVQVEDSSLIRRVVLQRTQTITQPSECRFSLSSD
jgi:hypothetical protein